MNAGFPGVIASARRRTAGSGPPAVTGGYLALYEPGNFTGDGAGNALAWTDTSGNGRDGAVVGTVPVTGGSLDMTADNVGLEVPEAAMPSDTPFQLSLRYALSDTSTVLVSKPAANTPWGIVGDAGSTSTAQFDFSADDGAAAYHAGGSSLLLSGSPTRGAVMDLLNAATVFSVEDLVLGNYRWDGAARSLFTYAGGDAFDAAITVTAIAIYPDPADRAAVESWLAGLTP